MSKKSTESMSTRHSRERWEVRCWDMYQWEALTG